MLLSQAVLIISGMFVVTFGIRFCLYARANKVTLPIWLDEALAFVPISVLSAIIVPMIFIQNKEFTLLISNPWFIGASSAFLVGIWKQNQLLTISLGVISFYVAKLFL